MKDRPKEQTSLFSKKITPEDIFNLFFKYSLDSIPVIRNHEIKGYISKGKTLRQANHVEFFKKPLTANLSRILENLQLEDFFQKVDKLEEPVIIPTVNSLDLSIYLYSEEEFNLTFRPVLNLGLGEYKTIFDFLKLPIFIFNSKLAVVYVNRKAEEFKTQFTEEKEDYFALFSKSIYEHLANLKEDKLYTDRRDGRKITYRLQTIDLSKGAVYVLYVITVSLSVNKR